MLKKIITLVFITVISVSAIFAISASAATSDMIQLIGDLGIVEDVESTGLVEASYTRGEFAKALMNMTGASPLNIGFPSESAVYAADISGNKNELYIKNALLFGHMETDADNNFSPNKNITKMDAIKALVNALNYKEIANERGGTDVTYIDIAHRLGILKGVSIEDENRLTVQEVKELIANAMMAEISRDGNVALENICYFDSWDVLRYEGKLMATSTMGLAGDRAKSGMINISGKSYYTNILIEDDYVGSDVIFYTRDLERGETVVSVYLKNEKTAISINATDVESISQSSSEVTVTYDNDEEIRISRRGYAVVNGKTMTPDKALFDSFKCGNATFLDTDENGVYDIVNLTLFESVILEGVSQDGKEFVTKFYNEKVELSEYDSIEVYIGKKLASTDDLKAGMLANIACDAFTISNGNVKSDYAKGKNIKIYVSNITVSGRIESIDTNGEVYIEDMDYVLGAGYEKLVADGKILPLKAGTYVTANLDSNGAVAYYEIDLTKGLQYGYLVGTDKSGGIREEFKFKILASDGVYHTVSAAEKIVIDGKRKNSSDVEVSFTADDGSTVDFTKRQVIRYRIDDEGFICEIDTAALGAGESEASSLVQSLKFDAYGEGYGKDESGADIGKAKIVNGVIDRAWTFKPECVVFRDEALLTSGLPEERHIRVVDVSELQQQMYVAGYDVNDMKELGCAVIYDSYGQTGESQDKVNGLQYHGYYGNVVEKITVAFKDGEEGFILTLAGENSKNDYFVSESDLRLYITTDNIEDWGNEYSKVQEVAASQLINYIGKGDIVRFRKNSLGNIVHLERIFDYSASRDGFVEIPTDKGSQVIGFANVENTNAAGTVIYSYGDALANPDLKTYLFKKKEKYKTVTVYYEENEKALQVNYEDLPSAMTGEKVKVFMRYYDKGDILDYIFYVLE